jgi:uncharacterized glyoxalase superfamily protein PhnB
MVANVNDTIQYYKDVLDFELVMSNPKEGQFEWAMIQSGDVALMLQTQTSLSGELPVFGDMKVGGSLTFFIETNDIDGLYAKVKSRADIVLDMRDTFYGMREFHIRDCNGYVLTFAQRIQ